jgi:hypothetical protein
MVNSRSIFGKRSYNSDGFRSEDFRNGERRVERDVGEHVHEGDQDAGDGDGARKVPAIIIF